MVHKPQMANTSLRILGEGEHCIPLHVRAEVQTCNHASWGAPTAHADLLTPTSKWDITAYGN